MKIGRWGLFLSLYLAILTLTGCWDNADLTRLAIATAVGVDKLTDGEIEVSVQIVKPAELSLTKGGGGGGSGGGSGSSKGYFVVSGKGRTIFEAIRSMLNTVDRKIFYSDEQVIVFGEELARRGILDYTDFFIRQHESKPNVTVLIAKGTTAKEILDTGSEMEKVPAESIMQIVENKSIRATINKTTMLDLVKVLNGEGKQAVIGAVFKTGEKEVRVEGAGVFRKDKLVGWLDPVQTRGFRYLATFVDDSLVNIPNLMQAGKEISIQVVRTHSQLGVQWENGKPVLVAEINLEGDFAEQQGIGDINNPEVFGKIKSQFEAEIKNEAQNALTVMQQYKSDIFGFGNAIYKHNYAYWEKVKSNWDEEFSKASARISVKVRIERVGLVKKSTSSVQGE